MSTFKQLATPSSGVSVSIFEDPFPLSLRRAFLLRRRRRRRRLPEDAAEQLFILLTGD